MPERHTHLSDEAILQALPSMLEQAIALKGKDKIVHFLETYLSRIAPERSPFFVDRDTLQATHAYSPRELSQLTDEDFRNLSQRLEENYRTDWFSQELVFHTQDVLEEKKHFQAPPTLWHG